jgi:hypothetical protein
MPWWNGPESLPWPRGGQGRKFAQERSGSFYVAQSGERISGTYQQSVQLVSGKYALV